MTAPAAVHSSTTPLACVFISKSGWSSSHTQWVRQQKFRVWIETVSSVLYVVCMFERMLKRNKVNESGVDISSGCVCVLLGRAVPEPGYKQGYVMQFLPSHLLVK